MTVWSNLPCSWCNKPAQHGVSLFVTDPRRWAFCPECWRVASLIVDWKETHGNDCNSELGVRQDSPSPEKEGPNAPGTVRTSAGP